jgi:hypothetical protein
LIVFVIFGLLISKWGEIVPGKPVIASESIRLAWQSESMHKITFIKRIFMMHSDCFVPFQ